MSEPETIMTDTADQPQAKRRWAKRLGWAIAIVMAPVLLAAAFLSSPIGKRFVADQIAQVSPASGLRFEVGRIEGDIYGSAILHDVVVKDPKGTFLTIPEVALDWRPLAWLWSGLDIRELSARRGRLQRIPELLPGDPDAPILPDFDIRVDKLAIENLTLLEGVAGEVAQRVDFDAKVDIRSGRALVDAQGRFGPEDRIDFLLDVEPDGDRFDLALDYKAADDGPIAAIAGLRAAYDARIQGQGTWSRWLGHALVKREVAAPEDGARQLANVAAFRITNASGKYGLLGQIKPTLSDGSILDRALGDAVSIAFSGTLEDSVLDGQMAAISGALDLRSAGGLDLADNEADDLILRARLRDPDLLGSIARLEDARFDATLAGPFRELEIEHTLLASALDADGVARLERLSHDGTASFDGSTLRVPLNISAGQVITGNDYADPLLKSGTLRGLLSFDGKRLEADNARIAFPGLNAELTLRGDTAAGAYALAGPVTARGVAFPEVGRINANSKILLKFGSGFPWSLRANLSGVLTEITNESVVTVAGDPLRFDGSLGVGGEEPLVLRDVVLASDRLDARLDSRIVEGRTTLAGSGSHQQYGPFTFDAEIAGDGPRAQLVLADPLPAAGLSDVRVGIAPQGDGFAIDVAGGSTLGPFEGQLGLYLPADAPTRIDIASLKVFRTNVAGELLLREAGIAGDLALRGGGLNGTIRIAPATGGGQRLDADLKANQARFGGETEIAIASADIRAQGRFGAGATTIDADIAGEGLKYGALEIASFAAEAAIVDGRGDVTASIAGRREERFALKLDGDFAPGRIALNAQGEYGGRRITMPRRAVLTSLEDGGYRLAPTQISFARGHTIIEGSFGGDRTELEARLASMPLQLTDLAGAELGLGGRLSGILTWNQRDGAAPTGSARVRVEGFRRSGLVLSSHPVEVFAVADLGPDALAIGARLREDETPLGRLEARITRLGAGDDLAQRIRRGRLDARLDYEGSAQALWRLAAIETFDITGPLDLSASATGTLEAPRISGNLASDALRLQSSISGTDIDGITLRGRFAGSRLELTRFSGATRGNGSVTGSGFVDLADISASRGPKIDIRAAARNARLLNANGLDATITGPLRIVSDGSGGAIAGRVRVDRASWALGVAEEDMRLPTIATREIGRADRIEVERATTTGAWRYLVDATAPSRVAVDGLGLDSEWGIDIALRGTVDDPRIGGEARLVRGDYTFAGTRFELTRGRIAFDESRAIDPRLDIEAEASANGTDVSIDITGNAQSPMIAFSSTPALPEEEILARLLFGGSVTSLSATDAVQLGAALAALQGGGAGLDPIGQLRRSIGLDQLRIVSADPALGRGTGVALGKNLGRRFYIELVTDGQGYSATQVEYRITRWLALLGTVTTIGRDSVLAEISRDY
ncbi:translocation/assembly module TamB domain-containing protein [Erythrobacter aurantius]|uniref:translocation/assembly module TamB domain-containing protein n=1 Tax=Erythrobacter aurantius TaxID=2909249 RepID=UPI002079ACFA|nr:translocation/assembly module TamB domain-containing protein [Erythrobacter aurantius]